MVRPRGPLFGGNRSERIRGPGFGNNSGRGGQGIPYNFFFPYIFNITFRSNDR